MDVSKKRARHVQRLVTYPVAETDDEPSTSGVLLSDRIEHYAKKHQMIKPFDAENLKPAGYELSIGDEFFVGGVGFSFSSSDPPSHIKIPPFEVAVIKTKEILRLPRFIIARWNLRVHWAYKGLLWIGAAQVDPGFSGNLFCPIYNLSDQPVVLQQGDKIALIDFVKTTAFIPGKSMKYLEPPERKKHIIEDYNCHKLRSALVTHAAERINDTVSKVEDLSSKLSFFTTLLISIIAILIATALNFNDLLKEFSAPNFLVYLITIGVAFSLVSSIMFIGSWRLKNILSVLKREIGGRNTVAVQRYLTREWWMSFLLAPIAMLLAGMAGYFITMNFDSRAGENLKEVQQSVKSLQSQISELERKINASAAD